MSHAAHRPSAPRFVKLPSQIAAGVQALRLGLPGGSEAKLLAYVHLLDKWNRVYNLTAVREPTQMVSHHVLDALSVVPALAAPKRLLDVGSGGGVPGLMLALAWPDTQVAMVDSNHKKTAFIQQAAIEMGLKNVTVITSRVELLKDEAGYDVVISRAFADTADFVKWSGHLLAQDGRLAAMKGVHPAEELARLPAGFRTEKVLPLTVPGLDAERHLALIVRE